MTVENPSRSEIESVPKPRPAHLRAVQADPPALLPPEERVLSTLNADGSRRWLTPRLSHGRFLIARRVVAYILIAIFTFLPYISINGKPAILLNIPAREFTVFGFTFLPTDTVLLALFVLGAVFSIFLLTALFGRLWCGWACPQTVYMEYLYRPLERLFAGTRSRGGAPRNAVSAGRRAAMYLTFFIASIYLAHTFLAYFVGVENLAQWVRRSPFEHPASFLIMLAVTALMMFDFCYFREQTCIVACPYGRLQSVLLDRQSLIISYDRTRGEPRGKLRSAVPADRAQESHRALPIARVGDCVDCGLCVTTCPTGIDIRDGLQMECIGCAQCIDACDGVMDRIGRRRGLIRYGSQAAMAGENRKRLRPRLILYPALLVIVATAFISVLATKQPADVTLLRGLGRPFSILPDGQVSNSIRIKITNRSQHAALYYVESLDPAATILADENPLRVAAGASRTEGVVVVVPKSIFSDETHPLRLRIRDDALFSAELTCQLLGPSGGASTAPENRIPTAAPEVKVR